MNEEAERFDLKINRKKTSYVITGDKQRDEDDGYMKDHTSKQEN